MNNSIVLIGPGKTGKTTVSALVGAVLGWPVVDLDVARWEYYAQLGYDAAKAREIVQQGGVKALNEYWKPFNIHAVEGVLHDYPSDHVIAFGWPHSIYDDKKQFQRAKTALESFPYVVLLMPSPDMQESLRIFRQRYRETTPHLAEAQIDEWLDEFRGFITHSSNTKLAKISVYTDGKSPEETCEDIIRRCQPLTD